MNEIKPIIFIFIIPLLILLVFFLSIDLVEAYNTQQDRLLFAKTYEIVIECRKSYGLNSNTATKVCGEVPVFMDVVK
jgi:hypothetical protein